MTNLPIRVPFFGCLMLLLMSCQPATNQAEDQSINIPGTKALMTGEIWEPVNAVIDGDTINRLNQEGELQGKWLRRYGDGSFLCTGNYSNGAKDGYWERKFPNGNWEYQITFKDGERHGLAKLYHETGKMSRLASYEEGAEQGEVTTYYETGVLQEKQWYINGIKGGPCELYDEEGILEAKGEYAYNRRNSVWTFYKDSKETMQLEYENGLIK